MTKRTKKRVESEFPVRTAHDDLAREAAEWDRQQQVEGAFREAPEAIPRASASVSISVRMPKKLLEVLKAFAAREGVGYQVLMKRWLDDRIRFERAHLGRSVRVDQTRSAPTFPLLDLPPDQGSHYQRVN